MSASTASMIIVDWVVPVQVGSRRDQVGITAP